MFRITLALVEYYYSVVLVYMHAQVYVVFFFVVSCGVFRAVRQGRRVGAR